MAALQYSIVECFTSTPFSFSQANLKTSNYDSQKIEIKKYYRRLPLQSSKSQKVARAG
jgi:hypothetical protein